MKRNKVFPTASATSTTSILKNSKVAGSITALISLFTLSLTLMVLSTPAHAGEKDKGTIGGTGRTLHHVEDIPDVPDMPERIELPDIPDALESIESIDSNDLGASDALESLDSMGPAADEPMSPDVDSK